jgi:steroid delta-isomerase-like uncharacterized protein
MKLERSRKETDMSLEETNTALVRRYFDEIMNKGNRDAIHELIAPDCIFTIPTLPDPFHGPDGYENLVRLLRTAFPDLLFKIEDELAEGDTVVDRWTATGTSRGPFNGKPPTGRTFLIEGTGWYRLKDGQFVENRLNEDTLGLLTQIGSIPAPGASDSNGARSQMDAAPAGTTIGTVPKTREIVEAYYRYVNAGDWTSYLTLFSDDVVGDEQIAGHFAGIDVLKGAADGITKGYSRFRMYPVRMVVEGESATVIWRTDSTNAAGVSIAYPKEPSRQVIGANYFQVQHGRIVYMRTVHDTVPFAPFIDQTASTAAAGSSSGR